MSQAAPPTPAALPDINAETHPFDLVQRLLDEAAFLNLYCQPDGGGRAGLSLPAAPDRVVGFDVSTVLRHFDVEVHLGEDGAAPTASNRLGEALGRLSERWMIVPRDFRALPDLEPPATRFDPARAQRFAILDSRFSLGDGEDGFRCFGTGATAPLPPTERGAGRVLAAAVATVLEGTGRLAGHVGTCTYLGTLDPEHGFQGNVLCRIPDHAGVLRTDRPLQDGDGDPLPEEGVAYWVLYGRKPAGDRETKYLFRPDGGMRGLRVGQELHLVSLAASAGDGAAVCTHARIGRVAGSMTSDIAFDLLSPGAPGTATAPIQFSAYNTFRLIDDAGRLAGTIDGDGSEGRTFLFQVPGVAGQRGLRFGGFGPLRKGTGVLAGLSGHMTDNSVVGLAPHATSTLYVLRVEGGVGRSDPAPASRPAEPSRRDDPFELLLDRLEEFRPRHVAWREGFRRCAGPIAEAVAQSFDARLEVGEFPGLRIDPEVLRRRLEAGIAPFDEERFERYRGAARGSFRTYDLISFEEVVPENVLYSVWSPATERRGLRRYKRITGSFQGYRPPEEVTDPERGDVDLLVNTHHPETGVTSWVSIFQHRQQERTSFAYGLPGPHEVMWVVKDVSLEGAAVENDVFMFSHEWKGADRGRTAYFMVGLFFEIDLDACEIRPWGDTFWRALYLEEPETGAGTNHGGDGR